MYTGVPPAHVGAFEWGACALHLGENPWFWAFFLSIAADLLTGLAKCWYKDSKIKASSTVGRKGVTAHLITFVLWALIYPLFDSWGLSSMENVFLLYFIIQYVLSIIENLGMMGVKLPPYILSRLDKLSDIYDEKYGVDETKDKKESK